MPTQRACQLIMMYSKKTFPSELALMLAISGGEYSRALFDLSTHLSDVRCREHCRPILEAVICAGHVQVSLHLQCSHSIISPSVCQILGRREHALEAIRRQWSPSSTCSRPPCRVQCGAVLASSLGNLSNHLSNLGYRGMHWRPF